MVADVEIDLISSARLDWSSYDKRGVWLVIFIGHLLGLFNRHEVGERESLIFGVLDEEFCWDWALILEREGELLLRVDLGKAQIDDWLDKIDDWPSEVGLA
jgi:hypothetical protein